MSGGYTYPKNAPTRKDSQMRPKASLPKLYGGGLRMTAVVVPSTLIHDTEVPYSSPLCFMLDFGFLSRVKAQLKRRIPKRWLGTKPAATADSIA